MNLDLVDLTGFDLKDQKVVKDTDNSQVTRAEFTHGLIVITEVSRETQQVRLHANYNWDRSDNGQWVPDLKNPNPNFHDINE